MNRLDYKQYNPPMEYMQLSEMINMYSFRNEFTIYCDKKQKIRYLCICQKSVRSHIKLSGG